MARAFNVYIMSGSVLDAAIAAARTCLVEAMLAPQAPCIIAGDLSAALRGHLVEAASPDAGGHTPSAGRRARRSEWLLLSWSASAVVEHVRLDWTVGVSPLVAHRVVLRDGDAATAPLWELGVERFPHRRSRARAPKLKKGSRLQL